eukprot:5056070-Pyramimonas_sp.AAC.1
MVASWGLLRPPWSSTEVVWRTWGLSHSLRFSPFFQSSSANNHTRHQCSMRRQGGPVEATRLRSSHATVRGGRIGMALGPPSFGDP